MLSCPSCGAEVRKSSRSAAAAALPHTRLRHEIERFGGIADKFIGDGVMGVFGVPSAHDPGRADRPRRHPPAGPPDPNVLPIAAFIEQAGGSLDAALALVEELEEATRDGPGAGAALGRARAIFERLGATALAAETDRLLAERR